jgi:hypothetical protein
MSITYVIKKEILKKTVNNYFSFFSADKAFKCSGEGLVDPQD